MAEKDQAVLLDGTEPVVGTWAKHEGSIYKIKVDAPVEQLFVNRKMMVEARWPNMDFETQLFDRKSWAATTKGSRYGTIKDPELAKTGIDWTGAYITLNVAHKSEEAGLSPEERIDTHRQRQDNRGLHG